DWPSAAAGSVISSGNASFSVSNRVLRQRGGTMSTSKETDLALVARCLEGDLGAFEELYRAHAGRLYSLAFRMLGNAADAEDLLQEIFLSAHRKLESFRGDSALGTWLYRLATNQILDHVRSRAARTGQLTDGLDDASVLADASGHRLADRPVDRIDPERPARRLARGMRGAVVPPDWEEVG